MMYENHLYTKNKIMDKQKTAVELMTFKNGKVPFSS